MGFFEKTKSGLRSLKWLASRNGRQYISEQKANRKGIENACEYHKEECQAHKNENPCEVPPEGWFCTRKKGHDGPCAAVPERGEK